MTTPRNTAAAAEPVPVERVGAEDADAAVELATDPPRVNPGEPADTTEPEDLDALADECEAASDEDDFEAALEDELGVEEVTEEPVAADPEDEEVDAVEEAEALMRSAVDDEDGQSAMASYFVDEESAQHGKWFRWTKLGENARLKIAARFCKAENRQWDQIIRRKGNPATGYLSVDKREKFTPPVLAKTVFVGMERVVIATGEEFSVQHAKDTWSYEVEGRIAKLTRIQRKKVGGPGQRKIYRFTLDDDGYVVDNFKNRLALLAAFAPGLQNAIHGVANNDRNFTDPDDDQVAGN